MSKTNEAQGLCQESMALLKDIVKKHGPGGRKDELIEVLNEVQEKLGYVPYDAQKYIAETMNLPLAEIFGVVTFYSRFSLKPVGKYKISVCMGTACYVKDAQKILDRFVELTGVQSGETSEDGLYSIVATRCIGACGLAPVITINEDVHGKLVVEDVDRLLGIYK